MAREDDLDALFAQAASQEFALPDRLTARILAEASAWQAKPAEPAVPLKSGWFTGLSGWFGGTGALAGMSAATLTGLYLGIVQPTPILALAALVSGSTTIDSLDLLPASATLLAQE